MPFFCFQTHMKWRIKWILPVTMTNYHQRLPVNTNAFYVVVNQVPKRTLWIIPRNSIREKTLRWEGLDRFQCENVDWAKGPEGHYMHQTCYTTLSNKRCLSQAEKRKQKLEVDIERDNQSVQGNPSPFASLSSPKRLRSSIGMVHDKNVCVWCRRGPQKSSHRDWKQLLLLSTKDAWIKFKLYGPNELLHAFGYNSAGSEPIWMNFGKLWAKCWGLDLADFGRDPRSSDSLRGSRFFLSVR